MRTLNAPPDSQSCGRTCSRPKHRHYVKTPRILSIFTNGETNYPSPYATAPPFFHDVLLINCTTCPLNQTSELPGTYSAPPLPMAGVLVNIACRSTKTLGSLVINGAPPTALTKVCMHLSEMLSMFAFDPVPVIDRSVQATISSPVHVKHTICEGIYHRYALNCL